MGRCVFPAVLLLLSSVGIACAGIHSHYFYWTVTNEVTSDFPSISMTRTLDDVTLFWFDIDNAVIERRVPWFKGPNATLLATSIDYYYEGKDIQNFLYNISNDLNDTEGYHILQRLEGCTLDDNGTVQASFSYHYDGEPFLSLNTETTNWTAERPEAEGYAEDFNSNTTILEEIQYILLNTCIPHITELLALGDCTFNRREVPVIKVTYVPIDDVGVRFYCRAYGHYPKDIFIMWYKNGQQISEEILERGTLPIPGLTYLTSVSFNVSSLGDDVYTCIVGHSSMPENFTQDFRISNDFTNLSNGPSYPFLGGVIAICLAIILIVVLITLGAVSFAKRQQR